MSVRKLLIVDPSTQVAEAEGVEEIQRLWTGASRVVRPALDPGDAEAGWSYEWDAVVVMGSRASVHDSLPWLEALGKWMNPILNGQEEVAVLGICFGHQLMGHIAGGEVGFLRADESKLVAVQTTRMKPSRLFQEARSLQVVCSHREALRGCPPGYAVIGERPEVAIDAIAHEHLPLFGVQFHPEARVQFGNHCGLDLNAHLAAIKEDGDRVIRQFFSTLEQ